MPDAPAARVRVEQEGPLGRLTLDRPEALNALDLAMIRALRGALDRWSTDDSVQRVLLDGAGDRGFCAGGDVRAVHDGAREDPASVEVLWREEYEVNALLGRYPKPVVVLADGLVMGGGLGLAGHVSHRVVTERSRVAMPETAIGLSPDVGGLHLLARAPGELGTHVALTSCEVGGADAVALGLADVLVDSHRLDDVRRRLVAEEPGEVLADVATTRPGPTPVLDSRGWVDECYEGDDPVAILRRLDEHPAPGAREAARQLREVAPTAVAVTLRAVREARRADDLEACLVADLRRSLRYLRRPDLVEGIRAKIIDKDRSPRWTPPTLAEVDPADLEPFFAPLDAELDLSGIGVARPDQGTSRH